MSHPPKTARDVCQKCVPACFEQELSTLKPETILQLAAEKPGNHLEFARFGITSWELTYPSQGTFEDAFPFFSGWDMLVPWRCHLFASGLWATDTGGSRAPIHPSGKRCTNVRRALRRVSAVKVRSRILKGGTGRLMVSFMIKHLNSLLMKH